MKEIHKKIWKLALPYQDMRDDKGHVKTVLDFALQLLKCESADADVVIPAAILHDIGWSQMTEKERMGPVSGIVSEEKEKTLRCKHEKLGAKIAGKILREVKYDRKLIKEITSIIDGHDTRKGFISKNDGIVRDADKLWRFSKKGMMTDIKRRKHSPSDSIKLYKNQMISPNYFYSKTAQKIALTELQKRKKEFHL